MPGRSPETTHGDRLQDDRNGRGIHERIQGHPAFGRGLLDITTPQERRELEATDVYAGRYMETQSSQNGEHHQGELKEVVGDSVSLPRNRLAQNKFHGT